MKNFRLLSVMIFAALASMMLTGCLEDECTATQTFRQWEPVTISPEELRSDITVTGAREIEDPGKIYYYEDVIFVNERDEGIHIIDNADPSNPQNLRFIEIPGNVDIAIKNDYLFADNYIDLLTIDISNLLQPTLAARSQDVFPSFGQDQNGDYIVKYVPTEQTVEVACDDPNVNSGWFWTNNVFFENIDLTTNQQGSSPGSGLAGSMASFSLIGNHLYTVDDNSLKVFDVQQPTQVQFLNTNYFSWGIETIFPYDNYLFIGSQNGMHIFDRSTPESPIYLAAFAHATACDPVFVQGDRAYVTLRDGRECETFTNQLDIIDISTITNPTLIASHQMDNPHGLSVWENTLYLCEGDYGLKTFNVEDPHAVGDRLLDHIKSVQAYDVISLAKDHLLLVGSDGIYQYDTSDPADLKEISEIPVSK